GPRFCFHDVNRRGILAAGRPRIRLRDRAIEGGCWGESSMFNQILDPTGNLFLTWVVALIPVVPLLVLLAGLRMSAWLAVLIGSIVTFLLALWVWQMPLDDGARAYLYGAATGVWNVDWITFWGVMLF